MADHEETDRQLARSLVRLLDRARTSLGGEGNRLVEAVTGHLGQGLDTIPNITTSFAGWEHVNVHRALVAYLAEHSPGATWFGFTGPHATAQGLMDVLVAAERSGTYDLGAPSYITVADGPDSAVDAVQMGLVRTVAPDGSPVVVGVRGPIENMPRPVGQIRILASTAETATAVRTRIEDLMREHDAYLGQVLQFDISEARGNELVSFLRRPRLSREEVILSEGVLDTIEEHVVLGDVSAERLRAAGQHLKRGVLLYGPPGTGKTHTVRYLMSRLRGRTVVVLSGRSLTRLLSAAVSLARRAQPSVIVVEDVDLIAVDRASTPGGNPHLFELLNRMDGVEGDADITFVLTSNRIDALERALSQRPGRVDLAVEIPVPDDECRLRLLRLYAAGTELDLSDDTALVPATEGVTASFIRELVRRAVLPKLSGDEGVKVRLSESDLLHALADLNHHSHALTRSILGASGISSRNRE